MRSKDFLLFETGKDGGPESRVDGFWIIRAKSLFTIAFLRFGYGSREAYHSHAFNSVSWVLCGALEEHYIDGRVVRHRRSFSPILTFRDTFHKVYGLAESTWVLTFRGPWVNTWRENVAGKNIVLTHNRVVLEDYELPE